MTDVIHAVQESLNNVEADRHLRDILSETKMEDSGTFDGDSPPPSDQSIHETSTSMQDKHIYTNIQEMEDIHNRLRPPIPSSSDCPIRNLNNGWMEYESEAGRTYFHHADSGKSQWIPPRFIRTPAEVQAFLAATKSDVDQNFSLTSDSTCVSSSLNGECTDLEKVKEDNVTTYASFHQAEDRSAQGSTKIIQRSPSIVSHRAGTERKLLKKVALPQVLPSTSTGLYSNRIDDNICYKDCGNEPLKESFTDNLCTRRESVTESREPVRTIRCGTMEKIQIDHDVLKSVKRREWQSNYMYLTSAHLIIYKDQKSAEKHGNHYGPPLGVFDLRGASISWNIDNDRKKKKLIQLELIYGPKYLLRTTNEMEVNAWFDALREVIANLPATSSSSGLPIFPSFLDQSCAIVRNPSMMSNRPHSTSVFGSSRSSKRGIDVMCNSALDSTVDEKVSRETILERLLRFFRNRPTVESLKEKGIYKPEPVFGTTLSAICQNEGSLVPKFIRTVTELIEEKGLEVDGLYRVSGNLSSIQRIRCQVDQDKYSSLVNEEDVHVLTGALKLFFRELADPMFPHSTSKDYLTAIKISNGKQKSKRFDELLKELPVENRETLKLLLRHLHRVAAHSDKNRMQCHNLAIMFGPTLFHNGEERKKPVTGRKNKRDKKDDSAPIQSNSHLAFNMIMQGQIVEYLLNEHSRFDALKGPLQTHPT